MGTDKVAPGEEVYCRHCGEPIPPARLKAMPQAVLCVDCQNEAEQKQKG
ncbi:TraR/DksA family transcriptional regulator [Candidatus Tokpelaia sp.]